MFDYDYVIVGAGSAGCVLAHRLSAESGVRVLLVEAGPVDGSLYTEMPAAFSYPLANDRFNWYYHTDPEPGMDHRRMYCPRGRVVGGSSSINGMVYVRGNALDYDAWAASGLPAWSYAHCLPYFKKSETYSRGPDDYRGADGPLRVMVGACEHPLFQAFLEAGAQAGYPFTQDMNGFQQEGFGRMDMTVHRGRRCSAAHAYLHPVLKARPNLKLETESLVRRILLQDSRAVGVEYSRLGIIQQARAEREVIVCGGAINSPQLLMLSGIGAADHLRAMGIEVEVDLPGVGENLQDHLDLYLQYECTRPITLYGVMNRLAKIRVGLQWLLFRRGIGASNWFEAGGFVRSRTGIAYPNLQYHFMPIAASYDGRSPPTTHGFQFFLSTMRPTSRGRIRLRSDDPRDPPSIVFNYLRTENDRREVRDGIRLTREIAHQKAFDEFRGRELAPGPDVIAEAELDAFARAKGETEYHPAGSCKMGTDDMAVVDGEARVHGMENLRVVDASIMPRVITGNLNAATIMLAEKIADLIAGRPPLEPEFVPVYRAEDYAERQR